MTLPWFRVENGFTSNPKVLQLRSSKRSEAVLTYLASIEYCLTHDTDGRIPAAALPVLLGTKRDATALVEVGLWDHDPAGWLIPDYLEYQPSKQDRKNYRVSRQMNACARWIKQGRECSCGHHH